MKRLILALALLATPAFAQQQQPTAETYLEQMVGQLAGQVARLQLMNAQQARQIEDLQRQLAEQKK